MIGFSQSCARFTAIASSFGAILLWWMSSAKIAQGRRVIMLYLDKQIGA